MFQIINVKRSVLAIAISAGMASSGSAYAGAVIFDQGNNAATANVALGVNNFGHLNFTPSSDEFGWDDGFETANAGPTGLAYKFPGGAFNDGTSPGCECEGWGVAVGTGAGRISAYASVDNGGSGGIASGTFGATPNSATSVVQMAGADVSITHAYGVSLAPGVFQGNVTITNNEAFTLTDLVYRRAMDWDIPPTEFNEYVTIQGVEANSEANGGNVRFSGDDGFFDVDPLNVPGTFGGGTITAPANTDFVDNGAADHGALFDFAFGDLAAGESFSFNIFYGAHGSEAEALAAVDILGSQVYSLGQSNPDGDSELGDGGFGDGDESEFVGGSSGAGNPDGTPATFLFAFGGVGGVEIGTNQDNPILPFVPAPGAFTFTAPTPRRWFDPPFVDGFVYELVGGGEFTEVGAPIGFVDMCIVVNGIEVECDFDGGELYSFGPGVTSFSITGISPLDAADPAFSTAFPTFLDWDGTAATLLMTSIEVTSTPPSGVPLPGTLWLLGLGLGGLLTARRVKKSV
ncbi:hypothetical protein [Neptunomonas japonica]|uniref:hypothetical protein n=1 Tax=Neptunomonas japonica TaxID=417574 RepID=UPI0003F97B6B|nr:hypothetical protein [Neptunomonas japonica]